MTFTPISLKNLIQQSNQAVLLQQAPAWDGRPDSGLDSDAVSAPGRRQLAGTDFIGMLQIPACQEAPVVEPLGLDSAWVALWLDCSRRCCRARAGLAGAAGRCRCLGSALAGLFSAVLSCSCRPGWGCWALSVPVLVGWERDQQRAGPAWGCWALSVLG